MSDTVRGVFSPPPKKYMKIEEHIAKIKTVRNNFGKTFLKNGPASFGLNVVKTAGAMIATCIIIIPMMMPETSVGK